MFLYAAYFSVPSVIRCRSNSLVILRPSRHTLPWQLQWELLITADHIKPRCQQIQCTRPFSGHLYQCEYYSIDLSFEWYENCHSGLELSLSQEQWRVHGISLSQGWQQFFIFTGLIKFDQNGQVYTVKWLKQNSSLHPSPARACACIYVHREECFHGDEWVFLQRRKLSTCLSLCRIWASVSFHSWDVITTLHCSHCWKLTYWNQTKWRHAASA